MSVLYIALPVAIAMGAAALWACVRCIRTGQFDDLDSPPMRMLIDDKPRVTTTIEPEPNARGSSTASRESNSGTR